MIQRKLLLQIFAWYRVFRFFCAPFARFTSVTPQAFSVPLVSLLVAGALLFRHSFAPPAHTEAWVSFHLLLIAVAAALGFGIVGYFFPSHAGCILFYCLQKEVDETGEWRGSERSCLEASTGSVTVADASGEKRRKSYCAVHDPSQRWMQEWLLSKGFHADLSTVKRNRFAEWEKKRA